MNTYDSALGFAHRGWPVIPIHSYIDGCCTCGNKACRSPGKHPLTPSGVKDATIDAQIIDRWWQETQGLANVGIATGNGLLVVDADAKSGGLATLEQWMQKHGAFPPTLSVSTGGGGRHYYFALPNGVNIGNKTAIEPGIDIRGTDGYVVAPPSVHVSGTAYKWDTPPDALLAQAPAWLLKKLTPAPSVSNGHASAQPSVLTVQPDLTTASGVAEGQRNRTLCRLVGIHLARREATAQIEPLALAWGQRCHPPMDDGEVKDVVRALANKHSTGSPSVSVQTDEDVDAVPLKTPAWPTLDQMAYHGLAGDVVRLLEPNTEADPNAILLSLLVCVGNSIGRKVWFPVEGDKHHPNLFVCLVGESSRGRKGTSLGRTLGLWLEEDLWRQKCIASGLSSGEGLKWAVRDMLEANEPIREKGKVLGYQTVIKDQGAADKRLLAVETEFAETLRVVQREGNTLSPVIRQAWDTGNLKTLTKSDPTVATDAHISILGHITKQELTRLLSDTDCANGFANRFLWALVKRSKMLPEGGVQVDLHPFRERLRHNLKAAVGGMARSSEARDLWYKLYPSLTADRPGTWGMATSRGEAQTLRLSMVYAILDGTTTIEPCHLHAAHAVWRYAEASAKLIFGEGDEAPPLEKKLLQSIAATPGLSRKDLHRALGGHVKADAMVAALGQLMARKLVRVESVATGGRPSERWWPAEQKPEVVVVEAVPSDQGNASKPNIDSHATERPKSCADGEQSQESSLVRTEPAEVLPLGDLLSLVQQSGGRLVRSGNGFAASGLPPDVLTPSLTASLAVHQADLDLLFDIDRKATAKQGPPGQAPATPAANAEPKPQAEQRDAIKDEMSDEEFATEFLMMGRPSTAGTPTKEEVAQFMAKMNAGTTATPQPKSTPS